MQELTIEEAKVVRKYEVARLSEEAADEELGKVFRIGYQPLLDAGDYVGAFAYIYRMPEGIAKLFAADYIRASRGDYDKGESNASS